MGGEKPIIRVAFNHPPPPHANKIFKKFEEIFDCHGSRSCARRVGGREGGWLSLEIDEAGSHEPTKEIS
jgi:hypothetical protein